VITWRSRAWRWRAPGGGVAGARVNSARANRTRPSRTRYIWRKRTGIEPEKWGVEQRDQGRSSEVEGATGGGSARNAVDREGACDLRVRFVGAGDVRAVDAVETALAYAIIAATEVRHWELVAQLATELAERRRAQATRSAAAGGRRYSPPDRR